MHNKGYNHVRKTLLKKLNGDGKDGKNGNTGHASSKVGDDTGANDPNGII